MQVFTYYFMSSEIILRQFWPRVRCCVLTRYLQLLHSKAVPSVSNGYEITNVLSTGINCSIVTGEMTIKAVASSLGKPQSQFRDNVLWGPRLNWQAEMARKVESTVRAPNFEKKHLRLC